jgi:hypothetical protein
VLADREEKYSLANYAAGAVLFATAIMTVLHVEESFIHPRRLAFVITAQTSVTFQTYHSRKAVPIVDVHRDQTSNVHCSDGKRRKMFADRINGRPQCPKCEVTMSLLIIEPERPGFDSRTFECPKCYGSETLVASVYCEEPSQLGHQALRSRLPLDSATPPPQSP